MSATAVLTKSIAPHPAERGIRAGPVSPGPTRTVLDLTGRRFTGDYLTKLGSSAPTGRVSQSEEAGPAYVHLVSDTDSSFPVSEVTVVTGGLTGTRR